MSKNDMDTSIMQRVIERPSYIEHFNRGSTQLGKDIITVIETAKLLEGTKCLMYDAIEFAKKFSNQNNVKIAKTNIYNKAKSIGVKMKIVEDKGNVYVWKRGE